jgi:hypothetical protein
MTIARAVLLVGSAKPAGQSTSESLARYLAARLEAGGTATRILPVNRTRKAAEDLRLFAALADADLFMLVTPLYVDSLPYLVTRTLEVVAADRELSSPRPCLFVPVINCGFPEARQCATALAITRRFAQQAGFTWRGGLAIGEGGAIDGRRLEDLGGMARQLRAGLDLAASALLRGEPVPAEAVARVAKPMMPAVVYTVMGNLGWRRQASRHGARGSLAARPYEV